MPWSIFQQGGGPGAAATWSEEALRRIGAPANTPNKQLIYDWEVSEGGGGAYNPLNEGPDPGKPWLSGGSHYGGGSAFSDAPLPGHKSALKGIKGNLLPGGPGSNVQTTSFFGALGNINTFFGDMTSADFWERAGLIFFGAVLIIIGLIILALPAAEKAVQVGDKAAKTATKAAAAAAVLAP